MIRKGMDMNMRRVSIVACAALMAGLAFGERRPKALMLFFDGCRADAMFRNADCPALRSLKDGTWAEGYRCAWSDAGQNIFDAPTLSYPNHASLLTGVTAAKHRILNNDDSVDVRTPARTWLSRLEEERKDLRVKAFYSDLNDGTGRIETDGRVPMFCAREKTWRACDAKTAEEAIAALTAEDAPDVLTFFTQDPDCTGHYLGYYPTSDVYLKAVRLCDSYVGRILDAIRSRKTFADEDWMITFTADHGGRGLGHGPDDGNCHTIPILVAGRHVAQGRLRGCPRIHDLPVTLLAHFGLKPDGLDGRVIGRDVLAAASGPDEGLLFHGACDTPVANFIEGRTDRFAFSAFGYEGGLKLMDGYLRIDPQEGLMGLRVEQTAKLFQNPDFTVAFWMRADGVMPKERPIVLSNRNFQDLTNRGFSNKADFPGFTLFFDTLMGDRMRGLALEVTGKDAKTVRRLVALSLERDKWTFYALSVRPDGVTTLCQGRSDGRFNWMAADLSDATWASGLALTFGQDASGLYPTAKPFDIDDVRVWSRGLMTDELDAVFKRGRSE